MSKNKWWLNGGRGSGRTFRLLCEAYENKIERLKRRNTELEESNKYKHKACVKLAHQANVARDNLDKAIQLLKWALHSDPEHDDLVDFDTKWKEAEQFIKEMEENG